MNEQGVITGEAWDYLRYTSSSDQGKTWSTPTIALKAKVNSAGIDKSACDPSVVFYKGFYYLYYGAAYRIGYINNVPQYYTDIQVARSDKIDGVYLTYTMRDTWEKDPIDPKPIVYPQYKERDISSFTFIGEQSAGYGAGQPSMLVKDDKLYMYYIDTSPLDEKKGTSEIILMTSDNPVDWGVVSVDGKTWKPKNGVITKGIKENIGIGEVRYDDAEKNFVSLVINGNHTLFSSLWQIRSKDGITWSDPSPVESVYGMPNFSHNIGMEGDALGHLSSTRIMAGFGSAADHNAQKDRWGRWDLKAGFVSLANKPEEPANSMTEAEQRVSQTLQNGTVIKESNLKILYDNSRFLSPEIFDWKYYTTRYSDLAFMNEAQARAHWLSNGVYEGRFGSTDFSVVMYIRANTELSKIFGWKEDDITTYASAVQHFVLSGKAFGRTGTKADFFSDMQLFHPSVFDSAFIRKMYAYTLTDNSEKGIRNFWIDLLLGKDSQQPFAGSKDFEPRIYLLRYPERAQELSADPDKVESYITALRDYVERGMKEGKSGKALGDAVLSNGEITLKTTARDGGAIASIVYKGTEFINDYDHGRQSQFAAFLNVDMSQGGECLTPTEAGSEFDKLAPVTSTYVEKFTSTLHELFGTSYPAFWARPGAKTYGCQGGRGSTWKAPLKLEKSVKLNAYNDPQIVEIDHTVTFLEDFPEEIKGGFLELPAFYMPSSFDECFHVFASKTAYIPQEQRGPAQGIMKWGCSSSAEAYPLQIPIIASTDSNGVVAVGAYMSGENNPQYAMVAFTGDEHADPAPSAVGDAYDPTHKFSVLKYLKATSKNVPLHFKTYLVFGDASSVGSKIRMLAGKNQDTLVSPENLTNPMIFDWNYYRKYYQDLTYLAVNPAQDPGCQVIARVPEEKKSLCRLRTKEEAEGHWIGNGLPEGRIGKQNFSVEEYRLLYPNQLIETQYEKDKNQLKRTYAYIEDYIQHSGEHRTGRLALADKVFDLSYYLAHNADIQDLRQNGTITDENVIQHWIDSGTREGRRASEGYNPAVYKQELDRLYPNTVHTPYDALLYFVTGKAG